MTINLIEGTGILRRYTPCTLVHTATAHSPCTALEPPPPFFYFVQDLVYTLVHSVEPPPPIPRFLPIPVNNELNRRPPGLFLSSERQSGAVQ